MDAVQRMTYGCELDSARAPSTGPDWQLGIPRLVSWRMVDTKRHSCRTQHASVPVPLDVWMRSDLVSFVDVEWPGWLHFWGVFEPPLAHLVHRLASSVSKVSLALWAVLCVLVVPFSASCQELRWVLRLNWSVSSKIRTNLFLEFLIFRLEH